MSLTVVTNDVSGITCLKDSNGVIQAEIDGSGDLILQGTVKTDGGAVTLTGALVYKGSHDASTAAYPLSPTTGDYYLIDVAGTISGTSYRIGDAIIYNGTTWDKVDNTEDAISLAANINGATTKNPPVDDDVVPITDSADSFGLKKLTWAIMKSTMKTYLDDYYDDFDNLVLVKSTDDLPVPAAGERTFAANTTYVFNANIADSNTWVMAEKTKIASVNGMSETLTYTGSGIFIKGTDVRFFIDDVALYTAGSGTLVQFNNTGADKYFTANSTNFIGGAKAVEVNGAAIVNTERCGFVNQTATVFDLNGVVEVFSTVYNLYQNTGTAGECIDTTGITAGSTNIFRVADNQWIPSHANHVFIKAADETFLSSTGIGIVSGNTPEAVVGSFLSGGLTVRTSNRVEFRNNPTLVDTQTESLAYITTPADTTIADLVNYVVVAGTWTSATQSRFTLQTSPNKFTYTGFSLVDLTFFATLKIALVGAGSNRTYQIGLRKNGSTIVTHSLQSISLDAGNPLNIPILASLNDVAENDYFELVILATSDIQNINVNSGTINIVKH